MAKKRSKRAAKRTGPTPRKRASRSARQPKRTPAKKVAAKKTPAKKTPAKKTPAKKTPAKELPAKKAPAKRAAKAAPPAKRTAPKPALTKRAAAPLAPAAATPPIAVDVAEQEALRAKFELGPHEWTRLLDSREKTQTIPWGYGRDRVTAMAVDPERLFVYWEVTDEAITAARARLAGEPGTLVLRVHDVTDLLFEGANAHHSFDLPIGRADRSWFQHIGRPTSQVIVELGLAGHEGRFAPISRSQRVEFPRRDPAPPGALEWLTVRELPQEPREARLAIAPAAPPPGTPGSSDERRGPPSGGGHGGGESLAQDDGGTSDGAPDRFDHDAPSGALLVATEPLSGEWSEASGDLQDLALDLAPELDERPWLERGDGMFDEARRLDAGEWEMTGPSDLVVITRGGGAPLVEQRGRAVRVREAPWSVEIRGIAARGGRRLLARWELRRIRIVSGGKQRFGERRRVARVQATGDRATAASEQRLEAGASERRWIAASELRLGGASEERFAGASERRRRGVAGRETDGGSEARLAAAPALPPPTKTG